MRWPWQKNKDVESARHIEKAAMYCFSKHHEIATQLIGAQRLDQIPIQNNFIATAETICCFLHFVDRTLTESAPRTRQERMDKLLTACITVFASLFEKIGDVSKDEADQHA